VNDVFDVVIIGAGPAGLSVAVEAKHAGLGYLVLEKGALTNSILRYPLDMRFFSTAPLLEIGGIPFTTPNRNPTRNEGLTYYREVADHFDLNIEFDHEVIAVRGEGPFTVRTSRGTYTARHIVVATGYYDNPNRLDIPGEDLPIVSHYYTEGHPFYRKNVIVIGGQNSSVEAALDLLQHKANVTMIIRAPKLGESVKYWLKPNLENRIKAKSITAYFESEVIRIDKLSVIIRTKEGEKKIASDFVFALTGYRPNVPLLKSFGIEVDETTLVPRHNHDTFETNIPGIFIAGSVACGCETGTIFIENGRMHASSIIGIIKRRLADTQKTRLIE
jgi:thioredoxin reductase (NADPH)